MGKTFIPLYKMSVDGSFSGHGSVAATALRDWNGNIVAMA